MRNRRDFIYQTAAGLGFSAMFSRPAVGWGFFRKQTTDDVLDLRSGFHCKVISRSGSIMKDGYRTPDQPDGMGCFAGANQRYVLMRNHELDLNDNKAGPYLPGQKISDLAYDKNGMGGVTRLVINPHTLEVENDHLALVGTARNCAGGLSPWGWLTCEETVIENHGYVFVCAAGHDSLAAPQKISAYGRFNHEAAAVDPATNICYLTEDRPDGCFYRFVPQKMTEPFIGTLQALKIQGKHRLMTSEGFPVGTQWLCEWVPVTNSEPDDDSIRMQAQQLGAAVFSRGEGLWLDQDTAYFSCTTGGPKAAGQIFALDMKTHILKLIAQSEDRNDLDMPDNITVFGDKIYMAEDGKGDQYIRVLKRDGSIVELAKNKISNGEFAGLCFSPDGKVLFANLQKDGITVAITGPFASI